MRGDEVRIAVRVPDPRHDDPHQPDQAARLLEALVLPEPGVEVPNGGMERIRLDDPARELLGRGVRHVHLLRLAHGLRIALRDLLDLRLVGEGLEEARAEDLVELVRVHPDGFEIHGGAPGFLLELPQRAGDPLAAGRVGGGEIGHDETDVAQLVAPHRDQQVGERRRRDHRQIGVADALRSRVDEVRRQLVEHDDERIAREQVHPRRLAGSGQRRVVGAELLPPAELLRDSPPDPEGRIALAPGEGDYPDRADVVGRVEAAHDLGPELGVLREQAESQQVVRLAAAHRLGQLEDALRGPALQPAEPLGEERLHPLGDVVLGEERGRIDAIPDEVREVETRCRGVRHRRVAARGVHACRMVFIDTPLRVRKLSPRGRLAPQDASPARRLGPSPRSRSLRRNTSLCSVLRSQAPSRRSPPAPRARRRAGRTARRS